MVNSAITRDIVEYVASRHTRASLEREIVRFKVSLEHFHNDSKAQAMIRHSIELYEVALSYVNDRVSYKLNAGSLKAQVELVEFIGRYTKLWRAGLGKYNGLCPLHHDTIPSLFVYSERQDWYCFGCHAGGDIFSFVQALHKVSFVEALKILSSEV